MEEEYTVQEELWLNAEGTKAVPKDDPKATHFFAKRGDKVRAEYAEHLGIDIGREKKKKE